MTRTPEPHVDPHDYSPITRQLDALRAIADLGGEIALHYGWRGMQWCSADERPIRMRVWERLLDRGDLEVLEPWGTPPSVKGLRITPQGMDRLGPEYRPPSDV